MPRQVESLRQEAFALRSKIHSLEKKVKDGEEIYSLMMDARDREKSQLMDSIKGKDAEIERLENFIEALVTARRVELGELPPELEETGLCESYSMPRVVETEGSHRSLAQIKELSERKSISDSE